MSYATSTCANCPFFQSFGESSRGWCHAFNTMAREHHAMTSDCEHQIAAAEKEAIAQPEETPQTPAIATPDPDPEVEFILALEEKIERATIGNQPLVEIDNDRGVYRVWSSYHFLGSFRRNNSGDWIAEPTFGKLSQHRSSSAAQRAVVRAWTIS